LTFIVAILVLVGPVRETVGKVVSAKYKIGQSPSRASSLSLILILTNSSLIIDDNNATSVRETPALMRSLFPINYRNVRMMAGGGDGCGGEKRGR
jgi:hypothetical protein